MSGSQVTTRGIRVEVESAFDPERSNPAEDEWFFVYRVRITNETAETVQLMSRHWIITDAEGRVEEVRGPGVVGQKPVLLPGRTHEYTSGCPLNTAFGTMHGSYEMVRADGSVFEVEIAPFALGEPYSVN